MQQRLPPPAAGLPPPRCSHRTPPLSRNGAATGGDTPTTPVRGDLGGRRIPGSPLCSPWMQRTSPAGVFMGPVVASPSAQYYAVAHFRAIERRLGTAEAGRRRVASSLADLSARRLRESVSEGASGSFFTGQKRRRLGHGFIVKQITKAEKDADAYPSCV